MSLIESLDLSECQFPPLKKETKRPCLCRAEAVFESCLAAQSLACWWGLEGQCLLPSPQFLFWRV